MAKVSIVVPIHDMENGAFFLWRNINSILSQTFKDYEIVITKEGKMAENTNAGIKKATGEIIKILYLDDYFSYGLALQEIVDNFKGGWLCSGCVHDDGKQIGNYHLPSYAGIPREQNTIGSPSVLAFENNNPELFNINMSWLLDFELYGRLYARYGLPTILDTPNITIGLHKGQMTHILTDEQKELEKQYL